MAFLFKVSQGKFETYFWFTKNKDLFEKIDVI